MGKHDLKRENVKLRKTNLKNHLLLPLSGLAILREYEVDSTLYSKNLNLIIITIVYKNTCSWRLPYIHFKNLHYYLIYLYFFLVFFGLEKPTDEYEGIALEYGSYSGEIL